MPGADRALLPWVRLHAASGYTDMAATCEKEGARVTFNFTPVLLEQIEEQAKATIADEFEHLSLLFSNTFLPPIGKRLSAPFQDTQTCWVAVANTWNRARLSERQRNSLTRTSWI
jgi:hypothetical protein